MENITELRHQEKAIALEDVMRNVRFMAGHGLYDDYLFRPGDVFDKYSDMTIEELHKEKERLECATNKYVQSIHFRNDGTRNINRILGDDEQDIED